MSKPNPTSEEIAIVWLKMKTGTAPMRNKMVAIPGENKLTSQETAGQATIAAI